MTIKFQKINKIIFLYNKLTTETELSGILSWALGGLHRLLKIGKFSYNKSKEQIKLLMERSGNPLASFVQDILIKKFLFNPLT